MNATDLAARLEARRAGDGWQAKCPAHEDGNPSLSISEGRDGRALVKCHAGCSTEQIVAALGIELRDLFADSGTVGRDIIATYDYTDESGTLLYQVVRFAPKDFRQRRPDGVGGWTWKLDGTRRVLYRLLDLRTAIAAGKRVFVVEGEKDADAVRRAGHPATCNAGGAGKWRDTYTTEFNGADVVVVADRDAPGRTHANTVARAIQRVAAKVVLVEPAEGKDVSDHLIAGRALRDLVPVAVGEELHAAAQDGTGPANGDDDAAGAPIVIRLSDVTPERVDWLWPGRVPRGKLTMVDGDPGLGKSTLLLDLAARVTTGRPLPDGPSVPVGEVVILSAEDGLADTIRPRLDALRADVTRVHALQGVRGPSGTLDAVTLPAHLLALRATVERTAAVLVIIDPFTAFLSDAVNSRVDHDIRRALAPLAQLAQDLSAAIILVRHLNKAPGAPALYRGGGSIALIGAARSGLLVARDPDDENPEGDRRVLAVTKANLCRRFPSLAFTVAGADNGVARIEWQGESRHQADSLVALPADPEERHERDEAAEFLRDLLARGAQSAKDVRRQTEAAGLAWRTVRRAADELGVVRLKRGFGSTGEWAWDLPTKETTPPNTSSVDTLGGGGHLSDFPTTYETPKVTTGPKVSTTEVLGTLEARDCTRCGATMSHHGTDPATGWICATCYPDADKAMDPDAVARSEMEKGA